MGADAVLRAHIGERAIFAIDCGGDVRKLFQVQFLRSDGSVVVSFPYHASCDGLVGIGAIASGQSKTSLDLAQHGAITSQRVKFVHHPDGEAHFSQDGRVRTSVRRKSIPLSTIGAHLFSIHVQGFEHFDLSDGRPGTTRRSVVTIKMKPDTRAIKVVGRLYPASFWTRDKVAMGITAIGPLVPTIDRMGQTRLGIIVRPPKDVRKDDRVLLISPEKIHPLASGDGLHLSMIGGFDNPVDITQLSHAPGFLALAYPASNSDELRSRIPSIDL